MRAFGIPRAGVALTIAAMMVFTVGAAAASDEHTQTYDLIAAFPDAAVHAEVKQIDFNTPAVRRFLGEGWEFGGNRAAPSPFRWGVGEHSVVHVFVGQPRPLTLWFRCSPFHFADAPQQRVTVSVNGHHVGDVDLIPRPNRYSVHIPADTLIFGENQIDFAYAYSRAPADVSESSRDTRQLAVAWDWLQLEEARTSRAPFVDGDAKPPALGLPVGTQVDYFVDLTPGAVLIAEHAQAFGAATRSGAPRLEVEFQGPNSDTARTVSMEPQRDGRVTVPVPPTIDGLTRVSLRAVPNRDTAPDSGFLLSGVGLQLPAASRSSSSSRKNPNIIIYLIDTLRADHLGAYGYGKPTSPAIDAFAREATLFVNATAQSSWTRSAVASIFTGLIPARHGVLGGEDGLAPQAVTLAERMEQAGYETAAFSTNANIVASLGFSQGFRTFEYLPQNSHTLEIFQYSDKLNTHAFEWLTYRARGRPFFLYLHATDPHAPYSPPSPFRERFAPGINPHRGVLNRQLSKQLTTADRADLMALYDGDIASNDDSFGKLIEKLKALGLYDSSLIVLIADHGEEFFDHQGWLHGYTLYMEQLHIPLMIHFPNGWGAGRRIEERVQQIDLVPTIMSYLGRETPPLLQGKNVLQLLEHDGPVDGTRPIVSSRVLRKMPMDAVISGHMKLIRDGTHPDRGVELYDLARDPAEQRNLAKEQPDVVTELTAALVAAPGDEAGRVHAVKANLDAQTQERLRAIGYGN